MKRVIEEIMSMTKHVLNMAYNQEWSTTSQI